MARKRDLRRDEARNIWLNTNGDKPLKDIAEILGVSDSQIRKWKSIDKWSANLKGNVTNGKSNVTNQSGAPIGNQNAKGNKGNSRASPPKKNKNAVKTGEYETIFSEYLSDEEMDVFQEEIDPFFVLSEEVRLLRVRQRRMMKRIIEAENGLNQAETDKLFELRGRKQYIESEKLGKKIPVEISALTMTEKKEKTFRKIEDILAIEDALTRISNQLTKAIKQLEELGLLQSRTKYTNEQAKKVELENKLFEKTNSSNEATIITVVDEWSNDDE